MLFCAVTATALFQLSADLAVIELSKGHNDIAVLYKTDMLLHL